MHRTLRSNLYCILQRTPGPSKGGSVVVWWLRRRHEGPPDARRRHVRYETPSGCGGWRRPWRDRASCPVTQDRERHDLTPASYGSAHLMQLDSNPGPLFGTEERPTQPDKSLESSSGSWRRAVRVVQPEVSGGALGHG